MTTSTGALNFDSNAKTTGKSHVLKVTSNVPVQIGAVDYSVTAGQSDWLKITPHSDNVTPDDATILTELKFDLSVLSDNASAGDRVAKFNVQWTDENDRQQTKQIQVVQMSSDFVFSVSTPTVQSGNAGGEQNFTVTSNKDLTLTATDDATGGVPDWFRLDATSFTASGVSATDKSFKVTIDKNKSLKSRSGKITIRRGSTEVTVISVSQSGTTASVTSSPDAVSFEAKANTNGKTAELKVTSNVPVQIGAVDYSATAGQSDWLKIAPHSDNVTPDDATIQTELKFDLSVLSDNTSDISREASFNVIWNDEKDVRQTKQIKVVQLGGDISLEVSPQTTVQAKNVGEVKDLTVKCNKDLTLVVTDDATGMSPEWFRLNENTFTASGVDPVVKTFKLTIDKNKGLKRRNGKISFNRDGMEVYSVTVLQDGSSAVVSPKPEVVNIAANAHTTGVISELKVESNVPVQIGEVDYSATPGQEDWLEIAPHLDNMMPDDATVSVEMKYTLSVLSDNMTTSERRATFDLIYYDENDVQQRKSIQITQMYINASLSVTTISDFDASGSGDRLLKINSKVPWELSCDSTWVHTKHVKSNEPVYSGNGNDSLYVYVDDNTDLRQRSAKLIVNAGNESQEVSIIQYGTAYVAVDTLISFKVKESTETLSVKSNSPWEISIDESGEKWLAIKSEYTKGKGSKDIPVQATFNSDTEKSREAYIYIQYLGPKAEYMTDSIRVEQDRCPKVPELAMDSVVINDTNDTTSLAIDDDVVRYTMGAKDAKLSIDTTHFDNPSKWLFTWTVDNEQKSNTNELDLGSLLTEKKEYSVKLGIAYEDDPENPELSKSLEFKLHPCPKCPDTLSVKGNGSSGIMIASFFDSNKPSDNDGYEYVFGYDENGQEPTLNPYYQFKDKSIVNDNTKKKWVYTQWEIDTKDNKKTKVPCIGKRELNNAESVGSGEVKVKGGKLIGNVATPTPAVIDIISVSGNTLRRIQLPASTTFNETIDTNGLPAGICIVKCTVGDKKIEQKMVIK